MMIGPETYYEEHLKGKTVGQIESDIRGLKREMARLKRVMEHPDYPKEIYMSPSEDVRLWCNRLYLERAKEALAEAGGTYTPTKQELKAAEFDENIPGINRLVFSIGGFHGGHETRTITFDRKNAYMEIKAPFEQETKPVKDDWFPWPKKDWLEEFKELHIGEWRSSYNRKDIKDGEQWELEIHYDNNHKTVKMSGSNAYPYNFKKFLRLVGGEYIDE